MSDEQQNLPTNNSILMSGSYYKIGVHGKLYYYDDGEWRKSNKTMQDYQKYIDKKNK